MDNMTYGNLFGDLEIQKVATNVHENDLLLKNN
jgi:hypothetical protein